MVVLHATPFLPMERAELTARSWAWQTKDITRPHVLPEMS